MLQPSGHSDQSEPIILTDLTDIYNAWNETDNFILFLYFLHIHVIKTRTALEAITKNENLMHFLLATWFRGHGFLASAVIQFKYNSPSKSGLLEPVVRLVLILLTRL